MALELIAEDRSSVLRSPDALDGEDVFAAIGCEDCHRATLTTSSAHPLAELRSQTIHPYSDLLLHDMGAGLADTLGEGVASGAEWRTTPLWGIGLSACVTGGVEGAAQSKLMILMVRRCPRHPP